MIKSTPTSRITIRRAKYSELYTCAVVMGKSFYDDVLFGRVLHPYRDKYPEDVALFFYRMWQSEWFDWSAVFLVAVEEGSVEGTEEIVGVAQWNRIGESGRSFGWGLRPWDPRNLLTPVLSHVSMLQSRINPNRAIDASLGDIFDTYEPCISHLWHHPARRNRWYLNFLGVHPSHQSKGIGRHLAHWGLKQAAKEGIGAAVIVAHGKDRFYQRCGFDEIVGWAGMGKTNPVGIVEGGNIWWVGPEVLKRKIAEGRELKKGIRVQVPEIS